MQQMSQCLVDVKSSDQSTGVSAESFNEMRIPLDEPLRESHEEKGQFVFELSDFRPRKLRLAETVIGNEDEDAPLQITRSHEWSLCFLKVTV